VTTTKSFPLSHPVTVGKLTVSALNLDTRFQVGWLREAPKTPTWFIGVVRSLFAGIELGAAAAGDGEAAGDDAAKAAAAGKEAIARMLANLPVPSGDEISEMIPWMLHVAEKATDQPPAVIDQLGPGDLLAIVMQLMPSMMAVANFPKTSALGVAISPGSSDGAPQR
jgi:hypothetical protein